MTLQEAFDIVFDLAVQNICNERDNPEEAERQKEALEKCETFIAFNGHLEDYD